MFKIYPVFLNVQQTCYNSNSLVIKQIKNLKSIKLLETKSSSGLFVYV